MHRGAAPEQRPLPDHLIPLGRTVGLPMNGAVSNLALSPAVVPTLRRELRAGAFDVVHVHEPNAPFVSWFATELARTPLVGTFHCYSRSPLVNGVAANVATARRLYNKLHVRIAVSEAAALDLRALLRWRATGSSRTASTSPPRDRATARCRATSSSCCSSAAPRRARACRCCCAPSRRCAAPGVEARLTVAGATPAEVEPLLLDVEGVEIAGRVDEDEKWRLLGAADLLVAPSLGGESFGMVLTEAFAAGTPVVASDIAGYRDVARDGVDSLLVPPADAAALGEALRELAFDPERRLRMGVAARERAERFAWSHVAEEVVDAYEDAVGDACAGHPPAPPPVPGSASSRPPACRAPPPRRIPSIEPEPPVGERRSRWAKIRRVAAIGGMVAAVALAALALDRIGIDQIGHALVGATPVWVLAAFALMCTSMLVRAEAWHAILCAALPGVRVRRRDAARATMIGVLMSATLPARLGEPSRALIMARRIGRVRDRLPVVLGSIVSQTLLNILALVILGGVMFATVGVFRGDEDALVIATIAPLVLLALVIGAPALLRRGKPSRFARVQHALATARGAMVQVRLGLQVFRNPRLGAWATVTQLSAWAIQWIACYVAAGRARPRPPGGHRRRRGRPVRGQRDGRDPDHAVEPRRLPGRLRRGPVGLRRQPDRRARLRDHPAGGRDRDRLRDGHARRCCARA